LERFWFLVSVTKNKEEEKAENQPQTDDKNFVSLNNFSNSAVLFVRPL